MQIIKEPGEKVSKLWPRPKRLDGPFRPIRYILREPVPEGELLHHTLTGELVLLDPQETAALDALPGPLTEVLLPLAEKHFVVPEGYDEHEVMQQLRQVLRMVTASGCITNYTILPTTNCNARCFYCYESDCVH